jgi:hypothetical protein
MIENNILKNCFISKENSALLIVNKDSVQISVKNEQNVFCLRSIFFPFFYS